MIDRVAGMMNAPPMPMNARLKISMFGLVDIAEASEPSPKRAKPTWSAGRRPKRSPRLPAVSSRPANTRVYESTIHCSWVFVASSSLTIEGSATLRIELSRTMTRRLKHSTPRISQRRSSARACTRSERVMDSDATTHSGTHSSRNSRARGAASDRAAGYASEA